MTKTDIKLKLARWTYKITQLTSEVYRKRHTRLLARAEQAREQKLDAYEKEFAARDALRDAAILKHQEIANKLSDRVVAASVAVFRAEEVLDDAREEAIFHADDRDHFIREQMSI